MSQEAVSSRNDVQDAEDPKYPEPTVDISNLVKPARAKACAPVPDAIAITRGRRSAAEIPTAQSPSDSQNPEQASVDDNADESGHGDDALKDWKYGMPQVSSKK